MPVQLKTTSETRSANITLTDDTDLTASLDANSTYFFDLMVIFEGGATPNFNARLQYSGTLNDAVYSLHWIGAQDDRTLGTAPINRTIFCNETNITAGTVAGATGNNTANTAGVYHYRGVLRTLAAGTFRFQWAQLVSDAANTTVLSGSYLWYELQASMPGKFIVKEADESRANTTVLATDDTLFFPTRRTGQYLCEFQASIDSATTPALSRQFKDTGVSFARGKMGGWRAIAAGAHAAAATGYQASSMDTATIQTPVVDSINAGWTVGWHETSWSHVMGEFDSNFTFDWAQRVSNASAATVRSPSWLWIEPVNEGAFDVSDSEHVTEVTSPVLPFHPPGFIIKPDDTVRTGSEYGLDPSLQFPVKMGKLYRVHGVCFMNTPNVVGGPNAQFRFGLTVAASGMIQGGAIESGTTHDAFVAQGNAVNHFDDNAYNTGISMTPSSTSIGRFSFEGYFTPAADGIAGVYWGLGNVAAGGSTQVRTGSWLYIHVEDP
jgi:hypothetical protein